MSIFEKLNGRKVDVNYETGYHFIIEYLSENELQWEALAKTAEGAPKVEKEPYSSYEIGDGIYNVNWIEESGLVVSQENARGKRAELLHKGTLTIID